jgi:rhodanese-related sulfurtransferase
MNIISVNELAGMEFPVLIDVRERDEWLEGHVHGAHLIPLGELSARLDEVPKGRPVYVMCHSGGRSAQAATLLSASGFDAVNVDGGITAWQHAQLPATTGAQS